MKLANQSTQHDNHVNLLMIMIMFFQWVAPAEGVSSITLVNTPAPGIHHHLFLHSSLLTCHLSTITLVNTPAPGIHHDFFALVSCSYFITLHCSVLHAINLDGTPHNNHLIAPEVPHVNNDNNVINNNNDNSPRCLT